MSGYPATLHGTELIIPMNNGLEVPVKWINGGSTQPTNDRPINITVEVAGKEFYADVTHIARSDADEIRVQANARPGNEHRRIYK
jgi:hypothetical protein